MDRKSNLIAGGALLVLAVWLAWPDAEPAAPAGANAPAREAPEPAGSQAHSPVQASEAAVDSSTQRNEVPLPAEDEGLLLHGRLTGLHPDAPWTKPVEVEVRGRLPGGWQRQEERVEVDADGAFPVRVPAWAPDAERFELTIRAEDPWYEEARAEFGPRVRTGEDEIVVRVRPVGLLTGKVVDPRGAPVPAARLLAFSALDGTPQGPAQARANTGLDGTYRLPVPVNAPLLVVAVPMHEARLSGLRMTRSGGGIVDDGRPRDDLLPAATWAESAFGRKGEVEAMTLGDPAYVTGVVLWSDGRPAVRARLALRLFGRPLGDEPRMQWLGGTAIDLVRRAVTNENGRFRLAARGGERAALQLFELDGIDQILEGRHHREVVAPQEVELRIEGRLVTIRVLPPPGSRPVQASVEWEVVDGYVVIQETDEDGVLRLILPPGRYRLHAKAGDHRSEVVELDGELPEVVELSLESADFSVVSVELACDYPVRQASFSWKREGDVRGFPAFYHALQRSDGEGPFTMHVAPGRYELRILPLRGERNGTFLLPTVREVVVPPGGGHFDVRVQLGGRITIQAIDGNGLHVAGTCTLFRPDGTEVRPSFSGPGLAVEDGAFPAGAPAKIDKNLPPGRYEVVLDLGPHGVHRREVQVRAREIAEVRIALR